MGEDNRQREETALEIEGAHRATGASLQRRAAILLSIALLPLGLLSVLQTERAVEAAQQAYRAGLAAKTAQAARPEREAILGAFGLARGVADAVGSLDLTPEQCATLMGRVAMRRADIRFIGFLDLEARSTCNNRGEVYDFTDDRESTRLYDDPRPHINFNPSGKVSGAAVIIVSQPVYDPDGDFKGFISLSFPGFPLVELRERSGLSDQVRLLTFNGEGEVLTSDTPREALYRVLPQNVELNDLVGSSERVFRSTIPDGSERDFALVPIVPEGAYALGSWAPRLPYSYTNPFSWSTLLFPLLMWLVTLAVSFLALRRMVVQPVRHLRMRFRAFADGRTMLRGNTLENAPAELMEIGAAFESMAGRILRDEAAMEDKIREGEMLLREVHHRVKNNLQLMSSIINMQIRQTDDPEAREALKRVQSRLGSLAKFHQDLYQSSSLATLRADRLLHDLAHQIFTIGETDGHHIDLRLELEDVFLTPDQTSPLAMLATEALTNALKHASTDPGAKPFVRFSLRIVHDGADRVRMEIENSVASDAPPEGVGLGSRLIRAFASQLEARVEQTRGDGTYLVTVEFERVPFDPDDPGTGEQEPAL